MGETSRVCITLQSSLLEEVKKVAKEEKTSVSGVINKYLYQALVEKRKREAGMRVLKLVKEKPLTKEQVEEALKELKKIRKESERWL
jgi:metal-responsive CopG/Arc/MetJ family transcriptional regulator